MVVDQEAALRHRDEKPELDENQQDRDKNAADRQRGAPLLIRQYPPSHRERHENATPNTLRRQGYSASFPRRGVKTAAPPCLAAPSLPPGTVAVLGSRPTLASGAEATRRKTMATGKKIAVV